MSLSTRFEQHTAHATRSLGKVLTLVPHDPATIVAIPQRPAYRQLVVDAGSAARGNVLALHAACLFVQDSLVLLLLPCDPRPSADSPSDADDVVSVVESVSVGLWRTNLPALVCIAKFRSLSIHVKKKILTPRGDLKKNYT